ncbi:MAG: hypothetical protein GX851_02505, partial [Clostridiales bacterium]|nr:hypothetical protein [Clostridiales bacterium]
MCFVISDTGAGISKDFIPEMFKPFTRENAGDGSESTSMGLGLSIAHNLIRAMDGNVSVESEIGKGSTFTIVVKMLKYDSSIRIISDDEDSDEPRTLAGCNVLMAEDNTLNRMILGSLLKNEGISYV